MHPDPSKLGSYSATFNSAKSSVSCGPAAPAGSDWTGKWETHSTTDSVINCAGKGCIKPDAKYGCTGEFAKQCTWDNATAGRYYAPYTVLTSQCRYSTLYTIHHTPYTIHHTPHTIHHTLYTIHYTPYTIHYTPYTMHHAPYTIHHTPYTIHHTRY
jgi:hypothetical protein